MELQFSTMDTNQRIYFTIKVLFFFILYMHNETTGKQSIFGRHPLNYYGNVTSFRHNDEDPEDCVLSIELKIGQKKAIRSPLYPSNYYSWARCQWTIMTEQGALVGLVCPKFALAYDGICNPFKDFLLLEAPGGIQRWYCGNSGPPALTAPALRLTFWSDHYSTGPGFSCAVVAFKPGSSNPTTSATTAPPTTTPTIQCKCGRGANRKKKSSSGDGSFRGGPSNIFNSVLNNKSTNSTIKYQKDEDIFKYMNRSQGHYKVIDGIKSSAHEFPWLALLVFPGKQEAICSGTLINDQYVLTAGHCLLTITPQVFLGEYNRFSSFETSHTIQPSVSEVIIHPNFDTTSKDNDIALIKLTQQLDLKKLYPYIAPACPPDGTSQYAWENAVVAGWGYESESATQGTDVPYKANVLIQSNTQCQSILQNNVISNNMLCARGDTTDSCTNDSGSTLIVKKNGAWVAVGLVSWGIGCARDNFPGVYTRIGNYMGWISNHVGGSGTCPV